MNMNYLALSGLSAYRQTDEIADAAFVSLRENILHTVKNVCSCLLLYVCGMYVACVSHVHVVLALFSSFVPCFIFCPSFHCSLICIDCFSPSRSHTHIYMYRAMLVHTVYQKVTTH